LAFTAIPKSAVFHYYEGSETPLSETPLRGGPPGVRDSASVAIPGPLAESSADPVGATLQVDGFETMSRWTLIVALSVVALLAGAILLTRAQILAAPEQPVAYSHQTHVQAEVQCVFCHSGALRSPAAGIPSVQKCMGCHAVIKADSPQVQDLAGYWERGEPIAWARVQPQPDFVYFSHQPHLGAGLSCETCHGDVGSMTVARPAVKMDMGWCLDCHLKQPESKVARLADCLTCHK
jgi:hypothetical protein